MTTRSLLTTRIRRAIHADGDTRSRPLFLATVTRRRPYSTLHTSVNVNVWAEASAQPGCSDDGHRVIHCRIGFEYTETPACRA